MQGVTTVVVGNCSFSLYPARKQSRENPVYYIQYAHARIASLLRKAGEERHAPHRIATYALETAQAFTAFYRDCRVVGAEPEALESFRIALSVAAQRVIARSLDLLGVSAPDTL